MLLKPHAHQGIVSARGIMTDEIVAYMFLACQPALEQNFQGCASESRCSLGQKV